MKKADAKTGVVVKVTKNTNGHTYCVGKTYTIVELHPEGKHAKLRGDDGYCGNWVTFGDIELYDRQKMAESLLNEANELEAKVKDLRAKAERFARYKDDTEELAYLIAETLKAGSEPAKIYEVLSKFGVKASLS